MFDFDKEDIAVMVVLTAVIIVFTVVLGAITHTL